MARNLILVMVCGMALSATLGLVGCGEGSSCRDSSDCSGSLECSGPNDPQVCGIPANEQCSSDTDCDANQRCHAVPDPCSPDGVGSECRPPCEPGGCLEGYTCGASGACEATPCDQGHTCPDHMACDPEAAVSGPVHARAHGCRTIACSDDGPCSDGACVNGFCQESLGSCVEPQQVP